LAVGFPFAATDVLAAISAPTHMVQCVGALLQSGSNDASGNHRHRRVNVGRLLDVEAAVTCALCHARAGANGLPDFGKLSCYRLQKLLAKPEHQMAIVGYARVFTQDKHLTGQLAALKAAGAPTPDGRA
jgi:hypothetical protein